jgi:GNAT superfamily N-acetyltransferase
MQRDAMEVQPAQARDIPIYTALARAAQAWLRSRGLAQFVPAAHDGYAEALRVRVEAGSLHLVRDGAVTLGFFDVDRSPSTWWPADNESALYLAGMVVGEVARGRGVGDFILEWSVAEAVRLGCCYVRLDCHADNTWLCRYYEARKFECQGRVEQHPGYYGCLYQRRVVGPPTGRERHYHG